ncbi:MAG: FecR family protein [Pseudomonadota bacterium]
MKRSVQLVIVLVLILGGAALLYRQLFPDGGGSQVSATDAATRVLPKLDAAQGPDEDAGREDGATATATRAEIMDLRGVAQRRLPGGRWADITQGDALSLDDTIRTLGGGSALVQLGNAVQVRLTPHTEVTIRELTERTSRVRIEEGRIVAEVNPQGRTVLRVEAKGSRAVAEASAGSFSMISDGRGQVAVATSAGSVKLVAAGESVDISAGQVARVSGDAAPTAPAAIPTSLYLKVAAPLRAIQREKETVVQGTATPGALVRAGEQVAMADERGAFRLRVPLREGKNDVQIRVTDVEGRERTQKMPAITVDTREPTIQNPQVQWGEDP